MVVENLRLVWHVAHRMARVMPLPAWELYSAGTVGLIEAVRRYDPDRGTAFSTWAVPRIRGAMIDEVRRRTPLARSQRSVEFVTWDDYLASTPPTAEEELLHAEQMELAQRLLDDLPERDRDIVLSWAKGETGVSIARRYRISEGRVTQLRQRALTQLQERAA